MTDDKDQGKPIEVKRVFEQPQDVISVYSDLAQVAFTGHELVLQFYETMLGPPDSDGVIRTAKTKLKVNVILSVPHATNIGNIILEKLGKKSEGK